MAKVFVTVSGTVIPRVSLNEILDVNTSGGQDGYVLTQQADGTFALEQVVTSLSGLSDVNLTGGGPPEPRDFLMYDGSEWINENVSKSDVGLGNVDNTSDADKPVSTATQTALNAKADTSAVPTELNDLSDVTIAGTPTGNQALIYDGTAGVFKSLPNFTNRFEDEAENNKQSITPFAERVYTVKSDGDGIFIDPDPDTPTAGKVIVRKIYHKAGFLESGAVIGDFTLIHTFADDTAYSATTSTFEGFRDGDTYGTPPFTLIQTWEEVTAAPAFTGLLNESYGSGAEAAYSVRRLNGNYTGAAIEVERSSDNTTQDIGFDSNGDLDESALTTFCTGTTCKVRTWYDQSQTGGTGSGNDAVQTTHANQPTIYTGGAIVKENGRPYLHFESGTTPHMDVATEIEVNTMFTTAANTNESGADYLTWHTTKIEGFGLGGTAGWNGAGFYDGSLYTINFKTLAQQLTYFRLNSGNYDVATNGATVSTIGGGNGSLHLNEIGRGSGSLQVDRMQEFVIYGSDKSTDRTDIESNIGDYFTQNTPLLDTYTGAAAAYSLRRLSSSYSGSAIRVRRASDNTEQDIGFNVFGELSTVELAAFCGSSDGFVKTWYSQVGTGVDATQTNTANQPKIYDSSTGVVTENGKPAALFSGDYLNSGTVSATGTATNFAVAHVDGASGTQAIFYTPEIFNYRRTSDFSFLTQSSQVTYATTNLNDRNLHYFGANASQGFGAINGGAITTNAEAAGSGTKIAIGTQSTNAIPFYGYIQECIYYPSDESSNRTNIESNINTFYNIYS